ncbi:hypothetical protein [Xenorhabdus bharatensis]|uniref:hypothetical protein n=1 Tax=Xenorhabdus bharatensis TaxID=3136256 RepID=UPI0030F44CE2
MLFISWPRPAVANPALAATLLVRVMAQTTAKRAATQAATKYPLTEAAMQATVRKETLATVSGMSRVAATRAATVPAQSALRNAGHVTWAGVTVAGGVMTASELIEAFRSDNLQVAVEGVELGNGRYEVRVGGQTRVVDFKPSPSAPVILYGHDARTPDTNGGGLPLGGSLVSHLPLKGIESYPVPAGVVQSNVLNDDRATYTLDIPSASGDYFYIENDSPEALKALFLTSVVKQFERNSWMEPYIVTANGDNQSFDYVSTSNALEVLDFTPVPDPDYDKWGEDHPFLANAATVFKVKVPYILHKKTIKSHYTACDYPRVVNQDGSVEVKTVCTPPQASDYNFSSERGNIALSVSLNHDYVGSYFNEKIKSSAVKVLSANELSDLLKDKPLDNAIVASLMNELLQDAAAQQGYEGIKFSDSDYITAAEVDAALKELGHTHLTASDLFSPVQNIESGLSANDITVNNQGGGNNGGGNISVNVDLGTDPNIKAPDLEKPPTGKEIAQPIIDGLSFIEDFKITGKAGSCPVVDTDFSLMGFDFRLFMDSHCDLIERNRPFIELITSLVWAFLALRVVLDA